MSSDKSSKDSQETEFIWTDAGFNCVYRNHDKYHRIKCLKCDWEREAYITIEYWPPHLQLHQQFCQDSYLKVKEKRIDDLDIIRGFRWKCLMCQKEKIIDTLNFPQICECKRAKIKSATKR